MSGGMDVLTRTGVCYTTRRTEVCYSYWLAGSRGLTISFLSRILVLGLLFVRGEESTRCSAGIGGRIDRIVDTIDSRCE